MKRLFILLILVLVVLAVPAAAQETNTVTYNGFSFSYDPAFAASVNITEYAGDPVDLAAPSLDLRRTEILLYTGESVPFPFEATAVIRLYDVADFEGYDFQTQQLTQLQTLLAERTDLAPYMLVTDDMSMNTLPFMPMIPAAQVIRARAQYVETPSFTGISYITAFRQDASPLLGSEFIYTFQGLSQDGSLYVSAQFRLDTALFPAEYPTDFNYDEFIAQINQYFTDSTATLNAAAPADFTPSLDTLDALIQTFTVSQ